VERKIMHHTVPSETGPITDPILVRRPAFPRWWDPIARPHVAIIVRDPISGRDIRYYLSQRGHGNSNGKEILDVADIDGLDEGTLLEVRYSATKANLYRLELMDGVPCWRGMAPCRELPDLNYPAEIRWNGLLEETPFDVSDSLSYEIQTN
jgi:hypothetical protein